MISVISFSLDKEQTVLGHNQLMYQHNYYLEIFGVPFVHHLAGKMSENVVKCNECVYV